jgi:exodeoxyribonuclease VII large subunit
LVQVKLYKDRGQISLTIEDIDPLFTQGALALARTELLKKLRAQGLDQKNKLLTVPYFPLRVVLITAEGSRAYSDFVHQLIDVGGFGGTLLFIPCTMQGDRVPERVVASIEVAHKHSADIIVICRGGGSAADLRWFDGEEVALAIAHSKIPIIAAIGHHDDTCVAEEICHTREKTPTAAADRILEVFSDTRTTINEKAHSLAVYLDREMTKIDRLQSNLKERLSSVLDTFFSSQTQRLLFQSVSLSRAFETTFNRQTSAFITMASQLNHSANSAIQQLIETVLSLHQQLTALDPTPWLKSGWTQLMAKGKQVNSVDLVNPGETLTARLLDGSLQLQVTHKTAKHKG